MIDQLIFYFASINLGSKSISVNKVLEPNKKQQSDNLHQSTNLGFAQNRSLVQLPLC